MSKREISHTKSRKAVQRYEKWMLEDHKVVSKTVVREVTVLAVVGKYAMVKIEDNSMPFVVPVRELATYNADKSQPKKPTPQDPVPYKEGF